MTDLETMYRTRREVGRAEREEWGEKAFLLAGLLVALVLGIALALPR